MTSRAPVRNSCDSLLDTKSIGGFAGGEIGPSMSLIRHHRFSKSLTQNQGRQVLCTQVFQTRANVKSSSGSDECPARQISTVAARDRSPPSRSPKKRVSTTWDCQTEIADREKSTEEIRRCFRKQRTANARIDGQTEKVPLPPLQSLRAELCPESRTSRDWFEMDWVGRSLGPSEWGCSNRRLTAWPNPCAWQ
jgi:hypothetical protein